MTVNFVCVNLVIAVLLIESLEYDDIIEHASYRLVILYSWSCPLDRCFFQTFPMLRIFVKILPFALVKFTTNSAFSLHYVMPWYFKRAIHRVRDFVLRLNLARFLFLYGVFPFDWWTSFLWNWKYRVQILEFIFAVSTAEIFDTVFTFAHECFSFYPKCSRILFEL